MSASTPRATINGRYEIIGELGRGAQGSVLEVSDRLFPDRRTALKVLGPSSPGALLRFEFEQLAGLSHPHLVRVWDLDRVSSVEGGPGPEVGSAFFTRELLDAREAHLWARDLADGELAAEVSRVCVAVARALALLHGAGLVHRDVKPSNILVGDGTVKLIDLGLGRSLAVAHAGRAGTIAYMAPEALEGYEDERSDLYGLGASMIEMLCERPPRPGRPIPDERPPSVPEDLWSLARRLTRPRPDDRLASAREVAIALGRALGAEVLGACRGGEILDAESEAETAGTRLARSRSPVAMGRGPERERIDEWLEGVMRGRSRRLGLAILAGPPGIGRTRLLRGAVVRAQLRASERGGEPPALVSGRLREIAAAISGGSVGGGLVAAWLRGGEGEAGPFANEDALYEELAAALSHWGRPAVFLVEEAESERVARLFSARNAMAPPEGAPPCALVAEMDDAVAGAAIAGETGALFLEVRPLDLGEERALAAAVLGGDPGEAFAEALHARTGGVPLLAEAVLSAASAGRGTSLPEPHDLERIDLRGEPGRIVADGLMVGLSPEGREVVEAWAVLDGPASPEDLAETAGVSTTAAAQVVRDLERRGWASRRGGERLALPEMVCRGVVGSLTEARAAELNRAALDVLEESGDADPVDLSRHAVAAGLGDRARGAARRAADILAAAGDLEGAAEQVEALLGLSVGAGRDLAALELARLCRRTGRYERALEAIDGMGEGVAAPAALERAAVLRLVGREDESLEALRGVFDSRDREVAMEARALAARIVLDSGDPREAARTVGDIEGEPDDILFRTGTLAVSALISMALDDPDRAEDLCRRGAESSVALGDLGAMARFGSLAGMLAHRMGRWDEAAGRYREALDLARRAGDRHGAATYAVNWAAALTEMDDVRGALVAYREGLDGLGGIGRTAELARAGANYAELLSRAGDAGGAEAASERALERAERSGDERILAHALCVRGEALLARGDLGEGKALFGRAADLIVDGAEGIAAAHHLAEALLLEGNVDEAASLLSRIARDMDLSGCDVLEQRRLEAEAALSGRGEPDAALDALVEALEGAQGNRGTARLRALTSAARAADRLGRSDVAGPASREALGYLSRLRRATPSIHRSAEDPRARELEAVRDRAAAGDGTERERDWERLVRINTRINSELRTGHLLDTIMDAALDVTGAERGFLLVAGRDGRLRVRSARNIDGERIDADEREYSGTVARRAHETGEPVITTDAQEDERFQSHRSVLSLDLRYIVAVPLLVKGRAQGTIYLDSRWGGRFDEHRLALLFALADQAAIALTNARLTAENRRRQRRIERLNRRLAGELSSREGELDRTRRDLARVSEELRTRYSYEGIVGRSSPMRDLFRLLDRITDTEVPVVIEGESGTGKELVARAIHFNGPRQKGAFVAESCAAIPETLLESVLFGHVRGAFTGAVRDNPGLFVEADGGTLFLDEVGETPPAMQAKLLRVLQEGEVRPVGGNRSIAVDVRVLAASNRSLRDLVREGRFREDLYYRLDVMRVRLPPLRERPEDIPLLAEHFAKVHGGESPPRISADAMESLVGYHWPGNVRQLENELMRAGLLCGGEVEPRHLSEEVLGGGGHVSERLDDLSMEERVEGLKRRLILAALGRTGGNRTAAAALLGISRYGLQKMMARLKVEK